ncbi:hypothetical protein [Mycolicibacterium thermoresistibile]
MTKDVRRYAAVLACGAALTILPMGVAVIGTPAPSRAECPAGQIAGDNGCRPHCPDGTLLDTETSKCLDLMSAAGSELGFSVPTPADIPPLVSAPVELGLPGVGLPGVGVGVNLFPPLFGAPALPEVGVPAVGLPERPPLCGPGIDTPIPMVGWAPCI